MHGRPNRPATLPPGSESSRPSKSGVVPSLSRDEVPTSQRATLSVRVPKHDLPRLWDDDEEERTGPTNALAPPMERTQAEPRLMIMTGGSAGEVIRLDTAIVIGRSRTADVRLVDEGVSRQHCRVCLRGRSVLLEDLGSTNGVLVNGEKIAGTVTLEIGDRVRLGAAVLQLGSFDVAEETLARKLFEASTRDPLTSAYNHHFFLSRLESEMSYAQRHTTPLSVLLLDLDGMKSINDLHGRSFGDDVLRTIVRSFSAGIRNEDLFCRYGGDEFAFLLREPLASAARTAERLRLRIEHLRITSGRRPVSLSASIGVVEVGEPGAQLTAEGLLRVAEKRLHRAKLLGRNRVATE
jgi:two-component system, cell cycle response regulator